MDVLSGSGDGAGQREDVVDEIVDFSAQLARVGLVSQGFQLGSSLLAIGRSPCDPVVSLLEREGHRFIRMRSIGEALDRVETIRHCDLILLDVILPHGQADRQYTRYAGKDLLRELRQEHGVTTPVVVLSVVSNAEVQRELESLHVSDIVKKPVLPSKLRKRVERVLESTAQYLVGHSRGDAT